MRHELVFASIRQGNISAADGWAFLSPLMDTDDPVMAASVYDSLRAWTWKALDRRRRDTELREWFDLMKRVEGFLSHRFDMLAGKIEVLAEMLFESIAVAEASDPTAVLERKHVRQALSSLAGHEGLWVSRTSLMRKLDLRPANTTRLMSLLVDLGWVEQRTSGREASYRISSEGLLLARGNDLSEDTVAEAAPAPDQDYHRILQRIPRQKSAVRSGKRVGHGKGKLHGDNPFRLIEADFDDKRSSEYQPYLTVAPSLIRQGIAA